MAIYKYKCTWANYDSAAIKGLYYYLDTCEKTFFLDDTNYYNLTNDPAHPERWQFSQAQFTFVRTVEEDIPIAEQDILTGKEITFKCYDHKVVAKMGNKKGIAKCHPDDEFDYYTGCRIALDRLFGKEDCAVESEFKFKVGDIVVIKDAFEIYPYYPHLFDDEDLLRKYAMKFDYGAYHGDQVAELKLDCIVRVATKHVNGTHNIYLVEVQNNMADPFVYVVGEAGLKKQGE